MEDDDIAMCGEGTGSINAKEKDGYVKEYIETEGLAMILSKVRSHLAPTFFRISNIEDSSQYVLFAINFLA